MKIDALVEFSNEALVRDFVFEIGGEEYECSKQVACMVFKKVAELIEIDSTLKRFVIDMRDDFHQFELMERLMNGESVDVNEQEAMFLLLVALKLENQSLIDQLSELLLDESVITTANVYHRLDEKQRLGLNLQPEIKFAAMHFAELNPATTKLLSPSILDAITSHADFSQKSDIAHLENMLPTMLSNELFADEDPVFAPPLTRWQFPVNCLDTPLPKQTKPDPPKPQSKRTPMIKAATTFASSGKTTTESSALPVFFDA